MADKFFHEFPPTTTLKDDSILLLDQDNQTTAITLAQLKSFLGSGSSGTNYTTVGNASAGIFVKAKCYTSGSGTWTAPEGCYTARVTVVGGGSYSSSASKAGGDSKFNYTGTDVNSTGKNQLIAKGGGISWVGGAAAWNGVNVLAGSYNSNGYVLTYPQGKCEANGYGGGGGSGGGGQSVSFNSGGRSLGRNGGSPLAMPKPPGSESSVFVSSEAGTGGSGGINGNAFGFLGGGEPVFSVVAMQNTDFCSIIEKCGDGSTVYQGGWYWRGSGGGWCTAIVNVIPNNSYSYQVGAAGVVTLPAGHNGQLPGSGMVLIEY